MAADLYRSALVRQTRAALVALEPALHSQQALDPDVTTALLERWGDAMRLGEPVGSSIRAAASRIGLDLLAAVVRERTTEAQSWSVPAPDAVDDDDRLVFTLCRRDETESLLQGLTRLTLARGEVPADVDGLDELCNALASFDHALAKGVDRVRAEAALGIRVALHEEASWLDALPERETEERDASQWDDVVANVERAAPSNTIVDRYVRTGAMCAYVEGYASSDNDFAETLADVIDELKRVSEPISLMAAIWRKRRAPRSPAQNPVTYRFVSDRRLAAASEVLHQSEVQRRELGPLPGVEADAALELRGSVLSLVVYPENTLKRVSLAAAESSGPAEDGSWDVSVAATQGTSTVRVLVEDGAGQVFEDELTIELR